MGENQIRPFNQSTSAKKISQTTAVQFTNRAPIKGGIGNREQQGKGGVPMINKREESQGGRGQLTMNKMVTTKERN